MRGSGKDDGHPAGPIQNAEARQASAVVGAQGERDKAVERGVITGSARW
jgi:hypothetical protein